MSTIYRQLNYVTDDKNMMFLMLNLDNFTSLNAKLLQIQDEISSLCTSTLDTMMIEVLILLVLVAVVLFLFIGSIFPIYYFV